MKDTRKIAKQIVEKINDTTNDYDAIDEVKKILDNLTNEKAEKPELKKTEV